MKLTNEAKSKEKNKKKKAVFDRVVHKTMTSPGLFFINYLYLYYYLYIPCNAVKTGSELRIWNAECGQQHNGAVGSIVASLKVLGLNPVPTIVQRSAC